MFARFLVMQNMATIESVRTGKVCRRDQHFFKKEAIGNFYIVILTHQRQTLHSWYLIPNTLVLRLKHYLLCVLDHFIITGFQF